MHPLFFISRCAAVFLASFFLLSCTTSLAVPAVRVQTEQHILHWEAELLLPVRDDIAPILALREKITETVESLAGDGSVNAYIVNYQLYFRLDEQPERSISLDQVVSVDEARYLAGRRALTAAASNLRREALHRMRFTLAKLQ